jgi:ubiquitin-conjugating enzyme (huntingtin interacting protein 2)
MIIKAVVAGPEGSLYEGGKFHIEVKMSSTYPFKPPHIGFVNKVYHPNINEKGCISAHQSFCGIDTWTPVQTVISLLQGVRDLMAKP